ncbi:MAG: peptidyl-prolyl cis-trans isomerase [Polyangiaceae bacterium]|nr:peptidyl-prolyl cis-trans isomerase [Polyangiaceae bacterium]
MRERRVAAAESHDAHDDHDHGHHGHDPHDHDAEDEYDSSNDPSWWVPHAVLGVLVLVGILGFFGAFTGLAAKMGYKGLPADASHGDSHTSKPAQTKPAETKPATPVPTQPQAPKEMFGAKHLLVMYKGSMRAPESVTRTKDEAKARAEEALKKAKGGTKFEDLVKEYSDEPGAGQRGGDLGKFPKGRMVGAFQDGLEKTKVGEVSDLVETPFGYHVILRTQ